MGNLELYEALKEPVGEEAARMIAEVLPTAGNLATKQDIGELEAQIARTEARIMGRLWVMFVPLWLGLYGLIAALLVRG